MLNSSISEDPTVAYQTTAQAFDGNIDKAWGSIGLICGAFTIVGNILVLTVLLRVRKRSLSDCAFVNLAIIDTISGMAAIGGSWFLLDGRTWVDDDKLWHDITCYAAGMAWNTASLTTPLLVCIVSIGRLAAVYLPLKYDKIFIPPVVYSMLTYCWLHGVAASTLSLWGDSGQGKYELYRSWGFCDQSIKAAYTNTELSKTLYLAFFTIPMMLTCGCIVISNLCVTARIILMKLAETPEKQLARSRSVSEPAPREIVRQKMQRLSRRISSIRYISKSAINNSNNNNTEESSFTHGGSVNSDSHYRHFEIMSLDENAALTGPGQKHRISTRSNSRPSSINRELSSHGSMTSSTCVTGTAEHQKPPPRKYSQMCRKKTMQKIRRAKRENRAILMTFLVSVSYLICYMEIINFYTFASFTETPIGLIARMSGPNPSKTAVIYGNLWYYNSLFAAAATNVLLHFLFNRVIRKGLAFMRGDKNFNSSVTRMTPGLVRS